MRLGKATVLAALTGGVLLAQGMSSLGDDAGLPESRRGTPVVPLLLLSRADIRADVGLNPTQTRDSERAIGEFYEQAIALRGKQGPETLAARRAIDQAQWQWLETHLSTDQRRRLVQIDLQWEGPGAMLSRPVVADTLVLSPEQRAALKRALDERNSKRSQASWQPRDEQQFSEQAVAILTPPQRDRWRSMIGPPFRSQPSQVVGLGPNAPQNPRR